MVALLGGGATATSKDQVIRVALAVRPMNDGSGRASEGSHLVRVTFQRIVRRTDGSTRAETLKGEELYRDFYERLSKSVFLEAHKI